MNTTFLKVRIWEELNKFHPYKNFDTAEYYVLAEAMIKDENHPARRFLSDKLIKELNETA
jgi:hypothetical protein